MGHFGFGSKGIQYHKIKNAASPFSANGTRAAIKAKFPAQFGRSHMEIFHIEQATQVFTTHFNTLTNRPRALSIVEQVIMATDHQNRVDFKSIIENGFAAIAGFPTVPNFPKEALLQIKVTSVFLFVCI